MRFKSRAPQSVHDAVDTVHQQAENIRLGVVISLILSLFAFGVACFALAER